MFRCLLRVITNFIKRWFANDPRNEYERIAFHALYATGAQLHKGIAS